MDEAVEDLVGHVLFGLLEGFARAHRAVDVALGGGFDDVLHRQRVDGIARGEVCPEEFGPVPGSDEGSFYSILDGVGGIIELTCLSVFVCGA